MGGSGDFDFLSQIPIQIILAPIFFGALYIVAMVIVFRRAAERRRRARAAKSGAAPLTSPARPLMARFASAALGSSGEQAGVAAVPEPDLDLLLMPSAPRANAPDSLEPEQERRAAVHAARQADDVIEAEYVETSPQPVEAEVDAIRAPSHEENAMTPTRVPSDSEAPGDAVELMRVWRDLSDGSLIIQIGDQLIRNLGELQSPDLARRFNVIVRDLAALAGNPPAPTAPPREPAVLPVVPVNGMPGSLRPPAMPEPELPKPGGIFPRRPKAPGPEMPSRSVAEAVEEFLQFRLASTPGFATRSIHVRPAHDGGVKIEVDGHYYETIGDVVDPDVRDFLSGMMKEWEARQ